MRNRFLAAVLASILAIVTVSCARKQALAKSDECVSCARVSGESTQGSADKKRSQTIVLGEAIVKSESTPSGEALFRGARVADLKIVDISWVFGKYYLVKFERCVDGGSVLPDEGYTLLVVSAFARAEGILNSEPNRVVKAGAN